MRMICICNKKSLRYIFIVGNNADMNRFLSPCFLEKEELRIYCRDETTARASWQSFIEAGAKLLRAQHAEAAFLELGSGLHVAHRQLQISEPPTWRWAMRLVESTNMLVVALNLLGYEEIIGPLLDNVRGLIRSLPALEKCPEGKNAAWLCRWCESMACPRRQAQMARMYELSNKAEQMCSLH